MRRVNGVAVLCLGTWEIRDGARVLGRVNALDAARALRRAAKKWDVPAVRLTAHEMLPTVFLRASK